MRESILQKLLSSFTFLGTNVVTGVGNHDSDSRNTHVAISANPPSIRSSIKDETTPFTGLLY